MIELPIQQEGIEYPFTSVLKLDSEHAAHVVKDRTDIFNDILPASLSSHHGVMLANWCNKESIGIPKELEMKLNACTTYAQIQKLLFEEDIEETEWLEAFNRRIIEIDSAFIIHELPGDDEPRPAA